MVMGESDAPARDLTPYLWLPGLEAGAGSRMCEK